MFYVTAIDNLQMQPQSPAGKISGIQALAIVFVAFVVIEAGFATVAAANYSYFYQALAQLQVNLAVLQVGPTQGGQSSDVTALFSVENPTAYQGIVMKEFSINFVINNSTSGKQIQGTTGLTAAIPQAPLDPNTVQNVTMNFQIGYPPTDLQFHFTVIVGLSTFLDTITGFQSTFSCDTGQPEACQLTELTPEPVGGFGPGGGGGT